jgi:hypothetical protein
LHILADTVTGSYIADPADPSEVAYVVVIQISGDMGHLEVATPVQQIPGELLLVSGVEGPVVLREPLVVSLHEMHHRVVYLKHLIQRVGYLQFRSDEI